MLVTASRIASASTVSSRALSDGGFDSQVSTTPADERNHPTLLRTQFVRVLKKPLTTVVVAAWVTQLSRWKMHPKRPTIGR